MSFPPEVEAAAAEAAAAVQALASPALAAVERRRLSALCENVKESPLALQCGLFLSADHHADVVRHLGLQILENTIKFQWNDLPVEQKVLLKDSSLSLMGEVRPEAPAYLRDALCRPLVEMVKREWPQQYAEFVPDMCELGARGPTHTELVLRVFLRLAEDVATFQTLSATARRRDVYRGLVANMESVLGLMTDALGWCAAEEEGRTTLAAACLAALDCYLEWAAMSQLMAGELMPLLLRLLRRPALRQQAAGCLNVLLNRHGRPDERELLLRLFEPAQVALLSEQLQLLCSEPPSDPLLATLRLTSQALVGGVSTLCYLWGRPDSAAAEPAAWAQFVLELLRLTQLPAVSVVTTLMPAWSQLLRHKQAAGSAPLLSAAPDLLAVLQWLARPRWAQTGTAVRAAWRQLELDSAEEVRAQVSSCVRALASAAPELTMSRLAADVLTLVQTPLPSDAAGRLDKHAGQRADWEVAAYLIDQVASATGGSQSEAVQAAGRSLLDACLQRSTADPEIASLLVSLLSALSVFLPQNPTLAAPLLTRLFDTVEFKSPEPTHEAAVRVLRRHGCNALVGLALRRPTSLTAVWPQLLQRVLDMLQQPGRLSPQEGVALAELLVLVHAHVGDYQQQSELVGRLLTPHAESWRRLAGVCGSVAAFVAAVGLDSPPEMLEAEEAARTRQQLTLLVTLLSSVVQRCRPPSDAARLAAGGFLEPTSGVVRCPAAPHVLPQLPLVFQLLRCLSALDSPSTRPLLHTGFSAVLDLSPGRRLTLLHAAVERPADADEAPRTPLVRLQIFLSNVYETAHTLVAGAFSAMAAEVVALPRLEEYLAGSVLHQLSHLSDHRIRVQVRSLWRHLVWRCPAEQVASLLHPLLATLFDELSDRLEARWQLLRSSAAQTTDQDEEDPEALVAEQLTRQLTRDSTALLTAVLTSAGPAAADSAEAMDEDAPPPPVQATVGAAGRAALSSPVLARPLLVLLFRCVGWGDSLASLKASDLAPPVVRALSDAGLVDAAAASQVLYWLLHGLQVQGHFEANYNSLVQAVTSVCLCLWPTHPAAVSQVLVQVPEASPEKVDELHHKIFTHPKVSNSEKMRREEIKRFVKPLVSCSMSQLFQKKVCIRDLLPMPVPEKRRAAAAEVVSLAELFGDS